MTLTHTLILPPLWIENYAVLFWMIVPNLYIRSFLLIYLVSTQPQSSSVLGINEQQISYRSILLLICLPSPMSSRVQVLEYYFHYSQSLSYILRVSSPSSTLRKKVSAYSNRVKAWDQLCLSDFKPGVTSQHYVRALSDYLSAFIEQLFLQLISSINQSALCNNTICYTLQQYYSSTQYYQITRYNTADWYIVQPTMHIIKKLDDNPSQLRLDFNRIGAYRSRTSGCLSLIAYLSIICIAGYKAYDVIAMNHVYVTQEVSMTDYNQPINISDMVFALHLQARTRMGTVEINDKNQYQHGINVTLEENYQYIKGGKIYHIGKQHRMISSRDNFFIVRDTPGIDNELLGRVDLYDPKQGEGDIYKRLAIRVYICDQDQEQECQPYQSNVFAALIFRNNKIDPYTNNQSQVFTFDPSYRTNTFVSQLSIMQTFSLTYYFKGVYINTDHSILPEIVHQEQPQAMSKSTWIYNSQFTQDIYYIGEDNQQLLKLCLKRSEYTIVYNRSFKKIDTVLAEVFGLVGLIFIIKKLILGDYNGWSFNRKRKQIMNQNLQPQLQQQKDLNLFKYYWQTFKHFSCCKKIKKNINKHQHQPYLDYHSLLMRMQAMQNKLAAYEGQNQTLINKPKMTKQFEKDQKHQKQKQRQNLNESVEELQKGLLQNSLSENYHNEAVIN